MSNPKPYVIPTEKRAVGRPKGSRNKLGLAIKDMILQALDESGGVQYLRRLAEDEPRAFATLLSRVIPLQVTGDADNPVVIEIVRFADQPAKQLEA